MPEPLSADQLAEFRALDFRDLIRNNDAPIAAQTAVSVVCALLNEIDRLRTRVAELEEAKDPSGLRYFVRLTGGPEREVTKEEFVSAERAAGFRNTMHRPDEPATSGFGGNGIRGWIEFQR